MESTNEALKLIAQVKENLQYLFENDRLYNISAIHESIKLLDEAVDKLACST